MQYMVRVELYGLASGADYESLHAAMARESFSRTLTAEGSGKRYETLAGTYWIESMSDGMTVLEAAKRAALSVYSNFGIMVAGNGPICLFNCREEKPAFPNFGEQLAEFAPRNPPTNLASLLKPVVPVPTSIPRSTLDAAFYDALRRK